MICGTIRLGVVGVRNIGKSHIRAARSSGGVAAVVAVADTDPARGAEVKREFDIPRAYDSADALLRDPDVEAVVLAVPNHLHAPLAIAALEAGKHVLVEKPMARTTAEADAMIAARDRAGRTLMVGMNQRFTPPHTAAKVAIERGLIGRFLSGHTGWTQARPFDGLWGRGDWFLSAAQSGGGPLLDLGIHRLDLALHLLGFPKVASVTGVTFEGIGRVEAAKRNRVYGIEDGAVGLIRFATGGGLTLEASYFQNTPHPGQFTVLCGSDGHLSVGERVELVTCRDNGPTPVPLEPPAEAATSCVQHFARVLLGKETLSPTAEQGRQGLAIVEAVYQSAATGEMIRL